MLRFLGKGKHLRLLTYLSLVKYKPQYERKFAIHPLWQAEASLRLLGPTGQTLWPNYANFCFLVSVMRQKKNYITPFFICLQIVPSSIHYTQQQQKTAKQLGC